MSQLSGSLRAGDLDRRIDLRKQLAGADEHGQPNGQWMTMATVWASFKPATGREFVASRAAQAIVDGTFRIRWRDDVKATWRIVFDGRDYDIQSLVEIGRREGLEILAQARQA